MHVNHGSDATTPVIPLRRYPQWWVVHTPEGFKAFAYRPHLGDGVTGPFLSRSSAEEKAETLARHERFRWRLVWVAVISAVVVAAGSVALLVSLVAP